MVDSSDKSKKYSGDEDALIKKGAEELIELYNTRSSKKGTFRDFADEVASKTRELRKIARESTYSSPYKQFIETYGNDIAAGKITQISLPKKRKK
jgi:hypothetical protein